MTRRLMQALAVCFVALSMAACGPKTTPEQRVQKLRMEHEITPVGSTTTHDDQGRPTLIVDLRVVNKGTVHLPHLTVKVEVRGPGGTIKVSRRVTLDLASAQPGVGIQVAAELPGVAAGPDDQVTVELENPLPPEVIRTLPEFKDIVGAHDR
ncbi:MAG: hypothetical protein GXP48_04230 [Acidobacteria bacterium]|nr:hypothetical protein [Acidobacteriota bacterium]